MQKQDSTAPDVRRTVIYQLFTRLFGNCNMANRFNGTIDENGCGKMNDITAKALASIRKLGATHVWYTGIIEHATKTDYSQYDITGDWHDVVKGNAGSPYAIKDYYDVAPDLAVDVENRIREFELLVQRTHSEGLQVLIDFVPNHVARRYVSDVAPEGTVDFGANDKCYVAFAKNNNFYYIPDHSFVSPVKSEEQWQEHPAKATGNNCFSASPSENDWYETVKLNYGVDYCGNSVANFNPVPDTWLKMCDILLYWCAKGVDGFRCDMAGMVPVEFWHWITGEVRAKYPETIFIAEIYEPERYFDFIFNGGFDYLYDKMFFYDTVRSIMEGRAPASAMTHVWQATEGLHRHLLYFLENHDEQRLASDFFLGSASKAISGMTLVATMFSNPVMLYFGQELGERGMNCEGFSGTDGRTTIFDYWGLELINEWRNCGAYNNDAMNEESLCLRSFYERLLNVINDNEALRSGSFYDLMYANVDNPHFDSSKLFAFLRHTPKQTILVIVNFADEDVDYKLRLPMDALRVTGLNSERFFWGLDLLNGSKPVQFPGAVALNGGFGGEVKARGAIIFNIGTGEVR
ncbi:MAG: alpha-amylase [Cytophagaceae bacterium]|jgi:glycosidase|nr:alpha-amylase [Cytophagaceae bacterium]